MNGVVFKMVLFCSVQSIPIDNDSDRGAVTALVVITAIAVPVAAVAAAL